MYSLEYNCLSSSLSGSMQLLRSSLLGSPDITIERWMLCSRSLTEWWSWLNVMYAPPAECSHLSVMLNLWKDWNWINYDKQAWLHTNQGSVSCWDQGHNSSVFALNLGQLQCPRHFHPRQPLISIQFLENYKWGYLEYHTSMLFCQIGIPRMVPNCSQRRAAKAFIADFE